MKSKNNSLVLLHISTRITKHTLKEYEFKEGSGVFINTTYSCFLRR